MRGTGRLGPRFPDRIPFACEVNMPRIVVSEKMPKKQRGGQEGGEQPGKKTTMKVAPDLLRKAKMVAVYKDEDLFDYIESILRPAVDRDYDQMIRDEAKE